MTNPKDRDENAKADAWKVPMEQSGVSPVIIPKRNPNPAPTKDRRAGAIKRAEMAPVFHVRIFSSIYPQCVSARAAGIHTSTGW